GFAPSRSLARQLVGHKYFTVNGKRMNIPSHEVCVGDLIELKSSKTVKGIMKTQEEILKNKKDVPHWLTLDSEKMTGKVIALPTKSDVGVFVDAQAVVEYYSK
ncbi:MAG: 30S ribosomal protein S4, partial [Candidatus Moraniibacteriota bacterium]